MPTVKSKMPSSQVSIIVALSDTRIEDSFKSYLHSEASTPNPVLANSSITFDSLAGAAERLSRLYQRATSIGAILISDGLVQAASPKPELTSAGKDLFDHFGRRPYATIAIGTFEGTATDVDQTLRPPVSESSLLESISLCQRRLAYLQKPPSHPAPAIPDIRPIKYEHEMRAYLSLRYQVYNAMCYLEPIIRQAPSAMELDWFDTRSLHLGAFLKEDGFERLIGTARLITTEPTSQEQRDLIFDVAQTDPILESAVENGAIQALLPVFQSQKLARLVQRSTDEDLLVGEISRVIVDAPYRGMDLSVSLTKAAADAAKARKVSDVLLECLPIHARVYRKASFERVPGLRGNVYGINRTMIVMQRQVGPTSLFKRRATPSNQNEHLRPRDRDVLR